MFKLYCDDSPERIFVCCHSDSEHPSQEGVQEAPGLQEKSAELLVVPAGRRPAGCFPGGDVRQSVPTGGTGSTGRL